MLDLPILINRGFVRENQCSSLCYEIPLKKVILGVPAVLKPILLTLIISLAVAQPSAAQPVDTYAISSTELTADNSDVMDDPAIWVNKSNPSKSLILATKKRNPDGGLYVYELSGQLKEVLPVGPLNNVDVRTHFPFQADLVDVAVASMPKEKRLAFFGIDPETGAITLLSYSPVSFDKKPYGLCISHDGKKFYAVVTFKGGGAEKWHFWEADGKINMEKVTSYPIETQAEGCVINDNDGSTFIAEEDKGIWVFKDGLPAEMIARVGEHNLVADLEGLALYDNNYIIVSSQGNSTFGVFSAVAPYNYLGNFQITSSPTQEGTESTDGIAVTAANLQGKLTRGLFIAHDNRSSKGGVSNFKLVPWGQIADKLGLE